MRLAISKNKTTDRVLTLVMMPVSFGDEKILAAIVDAFQSEEATIEVTNWCTGRCVSWETDNGERSDG